MWSVEGRTSSGVHFKGPNMICDQLNGSWSGSFNNKVSLNHAGAVDSMNAKSRTDGYRYSNLGCHSLMSLKFDNEIKIRREAESSDLIGFGQTEWMRKWANKIYQFQKPASSELDAEVGISGRLMSMSTSNTPSSAVLENQGDHLFPLRRNNQNHLVARYPQSMETGQDWNTKTTVFSRLGEIVNDGKEVVSHNSKNMSGNWQKRSGSIKKIRRDGCNNSSARGRGMSSPKRRQHMNANNASRVKDASVQREPLKPGCGVKRVTVDALTTPPVDPAQDSMERRIVKFAPAEKNSWDERRIRRKMRFENNLSLDKTSKTEGNGSSKTGNKNSYRPIIIDGNSVAFDFGGNLYFDWEGISICAEYFMDLGCDDITVTVPEVKLEPGMTKNPCFADQLKKRHTLLPCCENENYNLFVIKTADKKDAIIISNCVWNEPTKVSTTLHHLKLKTVEYDFNSDVSPVNCAIFKPKWSPAGCTLEKLLLM